MRKILLTIIIAGLLVVALSVPALADPPSEPGAIGEFVTGKIAAGLIPAPLPGALLIWLRAEGFVPVPPHLPEQQ